MIKLLMLLCFVSCIVSKPTEPMDSIAGYEYNPGTKEAQKLKGSLKITTGYKVQGGHKKRRYTYTRYNLVYIIKGTDAAYQCSGLSEITARKIIKKDRITHEEFSVAGIYLFNPMNAKKVGIQVHQVNNEPVMAFEVACEFPYYQKNNLTSDIPNFVD